jgi:hypothetical protein
MFFAVSSHASYGQCLALGCLISCSLVCLTYKLLHAWGFEHLLHGSLQELAVVTGALHAYDAVRTCQDSSRMRHECDVLSFVPACDQHA